MIFQGKAADKTPMRLTIVPAALAALLVTATAQMGTDYPADAGPAIAALAHGNVHGFVADQAQMGPLSLMLRAPLAALVGPNSLWAYRIGALACLLAVVALGLILQRRSGPRIAAVAATLLILNPVSLDALRLGHPEERLCSSLCVMALLFARKRPVVAGILLGSALATKQWALIAVAPVLIAAPRERRMLLALVAGGVAALVTLPLLIADPHAFIHALNRPAFGLGEMRNGNVWGFTAIQHLIPLGDGHETVGYLVPTWLQHLAHPLVAALTIGLGLAALRSRRAIDPLALLALLMLLRCALDPWDHAYYHAPFLAALIAWEVVEARRVPWVSALGAAWLGIVFKLQLPLSDVLYVLWAVPMATWLTRRALRLESVQASPSHPLAAA